jgi:hypothetical protein
MVRPEGGFELFDGFEGTLQIKHRIPAGDSSSCGSHCVAFLYDFLPRRAASFIGKHIW